MQQPAQATVLTAAQIAAIARRYGLEDVPHTESGVKRRAKKDRWPEQKRNGRGGGVAYALSDLPASIQAAAQLSEVEPAPADAEAPVSSLAWAQYERAPARVKEEAQRRLAAVQEYERLVAIGIPKVKARSTVAAAIGEHPTTLWRWLKLVDGVPRGERLARLAPAWAGRVELAEVSPEAWAWFKADYLRLSRPAASACYERLQRVAAERGWTVPSLRTLMRRLERELPAPAIIRAREGAEALKRTYPAQQRSRAHFHALEAVNIDGHKFDVRVRWEDGTVARPILVPIQDLFSNKYLAWRLGPSETSELVRLVIGDVVERYGIFDKIYMDNGRGFAAKLISGGAPTRFRFKVKPEDPTGLLTRLEAEIHWTQPYSGQSKPIERSFRDLCETIARHPLCEGAYVGSSPETKPENAGSRVIPIAEFRRLVDEEIRRHNARPGRRTIVCAGVKSFDEAFEESYRASAALIRKPTAEQLRAALLAAEAVATHRETGEIRLFGNRYWNEALAEVAGRRVTVRFDPDDLSRPVHVYTLDERFVATAARLEAAGFDDVAAAKRHQRARRDFVRRHKEALDAERRLGAAEAAAMLPALAPEAPPPATQVVAGAFGLARKLAPDPAPEAPPLDTSALLRNALRVLRPEPDQELP